MIMTSTTEPDLERGPASTQQPLNNRTTSAASNGNNTVPSGGPTAEQPSMDVANNANDPFIRYIGPTDESESECKTRLKKIVAKQRECYGKYHRGHLRVNYEDLATTNQDG